MRQIGMEVPEVPGTEDSSIEALRSLFEQTGFKAVTTRTIDVSLSYNDFEDFWQSQVPPFTPNGKAIAVLREIDAPTWSKQSGQYCQATLTEALLIQLGPMPSKVEYLSHRTQVWLWHIPAVATAAKDGRSRLESGRWRSAARWLQGAS
jgi:hypothetical protein